MHCHASVFIPQSELKFYFIVEPQLGQDGPAWTMLECTDWRLKAVIRISCNLMPWLVSADIFWVVLGPKKNVSNLLFKIGPFREIKTDLSLNV